MTANSDRITAAGWKIGLLASLGAGWLWDHQGPSATFVTSAAVAGAALAMLALLEPGRRPSA